MKGLAKRNNKTRGKTTRRRKSRGKTTRRRKSRGGSGGLAGMLAVQQPTYDDLMNARDIAEQKYKNILDRTGTDFNKAEQKYITLVKQLQIPIGYGESKQVDENKHPNKQSQFEMENANTVLNTKMNELNIERKTADDEYNAEITRINNEVLRIMRDDKHAREKSEIEKRNYQTAIENAKTQGASYTEVSKPNETDVNVQAQTYDPLDYTNTYEKQRTDMGLPEGFGGKKRKSHKK